MPVTLLATKLFVPPSRVELVPRPALLERLSAAMEARLTLLSAPAGFGKTTLLAEWATTCGWPVAWLSLEEADNDPERFLAYLAAALRRIYPAGEGPAEVATGLPLPLEPYLIGLINGAAAVRTPFALVLDDYHTIQTPAITAGMIFLVEHLPVQMHLLVASRADPPWPLARLRARGELMELRSADLRFTPAESAAFLNNVMNLNLTAGQIAALEARTEGWIAGLQMAALSMRGRGDVDGFLQSFTGSHHFILDYLVEEVLDRQPAEIQEFLLKTSVLERMCAELCEAVLSGERGELSPCAVGGCQAVLESLAHANLFVTPLDDEQRWFRCHPLFVDLLRHRLAHHYPDQVTLLHRCASRWYEENGLVGDAVRHALVAGEPEWIAALVKGRSLSMLGQAEMQALTHWLDGQPPPAFASNAWLTIIRVWMQLYAGEVAGLPGLLDQAEANLETHRQGRVADGLSEEAVRMDVQRIRGIIALQRCYLAGLLEDPAAGVRFAMQALENLPAEDLESRCIASALMSTCLRSAGDPGGAIQAARQAVEYGRNLCCSPETLYARETLAYSLRAEGRLREAEELLTESLALVADFSHFSGRTIPFTGDTHAMLSVLRREQNDCAAALRHALSAVELCSQWGQQDSLATSYAALVEAKQSAGDPQGANQAWQQIEVLARGRPRWYQRLSERIRAWLWLMQGEVEAARCWAGTFERENGSALEPNLIPHFLLQAWVWCQAGQPARTLERLESLEALIADSGTVAHQIQLSFLRALAHASMGQKALALATVKQALVLGRAGGFVRLFVDKGPAGADLIQSWLESSENAPAELRDYAARLLAGFAGNEPSPASPALVFTDAAPTLVEPLTGREREVLRLLASTLTAEEIAEQLYVAPSTIRTHIKNIYAKLGVTRRLQAVERAREIGLM